LATCELCSNEARKLIVTKLWRNSQNIDRFKKKSLPHCLKDSLCKKTIIANLNSVAIASLIGEILRLYASYVNSQGAGSTQ